MDEISYIAFAISPSKSPWEDGLTGFFYQKYWYIIGNKVCDVLFFFFETLYMPKGVNHTLLGLMQKLRR